jgi:cytochrome c oxidase assembly protein subunit 11
VLLALGLSYLAVPLYRMFCQVMGIGGTTQDDRNGERFREVLQIAEENSTKEKRLVRVKFTANTAGGMDWEFAPSQDNLVVNIGEPTLAFYTAKNNLDVPVVGVATYNVHPNRAGLYFHKVQCFCFDEQRLGPQQEVDMPVMFFLDPDMEKDKYLKDCAEVTLSYTFFRVEDEFDDDEEEE